MGPARLLPAVVLLLPAPGWAQAHAARPIARGTVLAVADLRLGAAASEVQPGWIARRAIREGEVLRPPAVVPPRAVRQGQTVRVLVAEGGVHLALEGQAMGGGDPGDEVLVRLGPNRRITGVITGAAQVTARDAQRLP